MSTLGFPRAKGNPGAIRTPDLAVLQALDDYRKALHALQDARIAHQGTQTPTEKSMASYVVTRRTREAAARRGELDQILIEDR